MTDPTNGNARPLRGSGENRIAKRNTAKYSTSVDPFAEVASRLRGVIKRRNGGILAFCPGHNDRKSRSLAVSVGREGRVLMHCFAGCSIHEITQAINLNPADLFPRSDNPTYEPHERFYFSDWQVVRSILLDSLMVLLAARTVLAGKVLPASDVECLSKAVARISAGVEYAMGANNGSE